MNGTDLMDYGFSEMAVSNPVFDPPLAKRGEVAESKQTYLNDEPFKCPMSKDVWKSKILHDARCQYKYCKRGWDFNHNLIPMNLNI